MSKIGFLIVKGIFIAILVFHFLIGCSTTNAIDKNTSDKTLPSKYQKYVDINQNPISYKGNTMVMLPEGKNKKIGYAFINQKKELIIEDDNPIGYLKYDTQGNVIDKIETKQLDGTEHLLDKFYGDYLMDFKGKRYSSWAIDGDKSFKEMELVPHSEQWNIETQENFYLEEIKDKSPYYNIIDNTFFFFKDNKWSYFNTVINYETINWLELKYRELIDEKLMNWLLNGKPPLFNDDNKYEAPYLTFSEKMAEGQSTSIFSRRERNFIPKEESEKRDKFIPEYFKVEERDSHRGSTIGGGSISHLSTWEKGVLFFKLQINGKTFGLKNEESTHNHRNIMKDKTSYFHIYGGVLENCGEYDVYSHPQLEYALFAPNEILSYGICPVFIIKKKKE